MRTNHPLFHRICLAGLTALAVVTVYGFAAPGGSRAQTPPAPTATATNTEVPTATGTTVIIPAGTQTAAAGTVNLAQVPTSTATTAVPSPTTVIPNVAATATYVALLNQIQQQQQQQLQQIPTPTPISTIAPQVTVTPVTISVAPQATQTAPSGATAQDACALSLASAEGGQTIEFEQVAITLPAGSYTYGFIRAENGVTPQVVVCSPQTASTIYINAMTGAESARRANGEAGANSLNQIRAGVRSRTTAAGTIPAISPPNTGDAGLR